MNEYNEFILRLVNMKAEADRIGLHATARALDKATQAVGWEVADKMTPVKPRRNKMRERQLGLR